MRIPQLSRSTWGWIGAALVVSALLLRFGGVWMLGPTVYVPETQVSGEPRPQPGDHIFTTWLVGRNARMLATSPWNFFEAEPCYPVEKPIALGEHGVGLGVLGVPGYLLTRDPVASYNVAIAVSILAAAVAVGWLVFGWTGVPAAAIVAGLLYAFAVQRIVDLAHWFILENVGTAFALVFAERALSRGRWQDTLLAGASIAMQLGSSLYAVISAVLLAPPMVIWLVLRHGVRKLRPWAVALSLLLVLAAAYGIYSPYLALQAGGDVLQSRGEQLFLGWDWLLPGGRSFPGLIPAGLALSSLFLGRRRIFVAGGGDARIPLVIGALLVLIMATGGNAQLGAVSRSAWPNPYLWIAPFIPGLEVIRTPAAIQSGFLLVVPILAGLGVAGWIRLVPEERSTLAQLVAVVAVWLSIVIGPLTGRYAGLEFRPLEVAPKEATLAAIEDLEAAGVTGPVLELPMDPETIRYVFIDNPARVLLSDYHRWRTASCYNSFLPGEAGRAAGLAGRVPEAAALAELHRLGFEAILIHHKKFDFASVRLAICMRQLASEEASGLRTLLRSPPLSAFALEPPFRGPAERPPECYPKKDKRSESGAEPGSGARSDGAPGNLD